MKRALLKYFKKNGISGSFSSKIQRIRTSCFLILKYKKIGTNRFFKFSNNYTTLVNILMLANS
jgi:hypothetical protein